MAAPHRGRPATAGIRSTAPWTTRRGPQVDMEGLAALAAGRPSWMFEGACNRYAGVIDFVPDTQAEAREPKRVCDTECPVRARCLAYGLSQRTTKGRPALDGVWGGATKYERARMLREGTDVLPIDVPGYVTRMPTRQHRIAELVRLGHTQPAIALTFGVSVKTVERDLSLLRRDQKAERDRAEQRRAAGAVARAEIAARL